MLLILSGKSVKGQDSCREPVVHSPKLTCRVYCYRMTLRRKGDALAWLERFPDTRRQKKTRGRPRRMRPAPLAETGGRRPSGDDRSGGDAKEGFNEGLEGDSLQGADPQAWLQRFQEAKAGMRRRPAAAGARNPTHTQQSGAPLGDAAARHDSAGSRPSAAT